MLDVHALGVHDLLDDVGAHLLLALRVLVAGLAGVLVLLFPMGAATALRQLLLIDSKLQATHRRQAVYRRGSRSRGKANTTLASALCAGAIKSWCPGAVATSSGLFAFIKILTIATLFLTGLAYAWY